MRFGVPKETKDHEYRVGMLPEGVRQLVEDGHEVWVERGAGLGSGFSDEAYERHGARLVGVEDAWSAPEVVVKVKEPNPVEARRLRPGQVVFAYLHLAASAEVTRALLDAGVVALAYETIQDADGRFPVLAPMSEVAGRLAVQAGATLLHRDKGGKGLLLGGVPGVPRGRVTVVGAGTVGANALRVAHGLRAEVTVLDVSAARLAAVHDLFDGNVTTLYASRANLERSVVESDLLIGAVYVRGRRAPRLVPERCIAGMEEGSVVVDVAVDQGGCIETTHPTTLSDPTYVVHGVVHYAVANMPAAVPRSSTIALNNATLPYVEALAELGVEEALRRDPALALGANLWRGDVVCEGVAEAHGLPLARLPI